MQAGVVVRGIVWAIALSVYAGTAAADSLAAWTKAAAPGTAGVPEAPPDAAREALEGAVRDAAGSHAVHLAWARVVDRPARGPALVVLAGESATAPPTDPRARREGVLALAAVDGEKVTVRDRQRIPLPDGLTWSFLTAADLDGDRRPEALATWDEGGRRNGVVIARTAPPGLSFIELGGARQTAPEVACFLPVSGQKGQAMVIQRRGAGGDDTLQVLLPRADGRYGGGRVYAAVLSSGDSEDDARARWRQVFALKEAATAQRRQAEPGPCPAPAVLLRADALGGRANAGHAILGPLADSAAGVEQAVRRLGPRAPRAILVVALGD
jgi:hypothetical protein